MRQILFLLLLALSGNTTAFEFSDVSARARTLAQQPYKTPGETLPRALNELNYDQYRDIRFKPERALWRDSGLPFEVQLFHPGFYFKQPVRIHVVQKNSVRPLKFDPKLFSYGRNTLNPEMLAEVDGYAGFRVHYPLNSKKYKDELVVFQGASYFRALGQAQQYGLSARGLAVDTAQPSGEEFPGFTEFWIVQPQPRDKELTIFALLDSRRVTGAYRFQIKPGSSTTMQVQSQIYLREPVGKLGLAPLTSMFDFGENDPSPREDYRPEVHDSDGLMVQLDREWLWRPLVNPRRLLITSFGALNPRGFGLMQRDRNFARYEDLEARYDRRPSAWITPKGDWGRGRIELVQIPTPDETNDNIVAYWVPEQAPAPGQPLALSYELSWQLKQETKPPLAAVTQTRRGHGFVTQEDESFLYHIDFEGGELARLKQDAKISLLAWSGDNGVLLEQRGEPNPVSGGWRVTLRVEREDEEKPVELRCVLRNGDKVISETWSYVIPPYTRRE